MYKELIILIAIWCFLLSNMIFAQLIIVCSSWFIWPIIIINFPLLLTCGGVIGMIMGNKKRWE